MTQEDKSLLIKDLCARLPYGVMCQVDDGAAGLNDGKLAQINIPKELAKFDVDYCWDAYIDDIKPYLRPMSSMTDEEFLYFMGVRGMNFKSHEIQEIMSEYFSHPDSMAIVNRLGSYSHNMDWLNKNMFDYRGLIPMGLALEAPEGMYK